MSEEVLVTFYAGDEEKTMDMLNHLGMTLEEWDEMSEVAQDNAIDSEHELWMWNRGLVGWKRL